MKYFVLTVCAVAEVIFLTLISDGFFLRRTVPRWRMALIYILFSAGAAALAMSPKLVLVRGLYWALGGGALVWLNYDAKPLQALLAAATLVIISAISATAVTILLSFTGPEDRDAVIRGAWSLYVTICRLSDLLFVVAVRLAGDYLTGRPRTRIFLPAYPGLAIGIMFVCLIASEISGRAEIIALGLLYTCIVVILFTLRLQDQENERRELEQANDRYATQKTYYEQLQAQQEQIRALWHDLDKYLHAVQAETGQSPSLDQLRDMAGAVRPVVDVDNRVVSIILNEYVQAAEEAGARLTLDVQVPPEISVTAADLYILIGNTVDNALEAVAALPEERRRIDLKLRMHNGMLFYEISNPYDPDQGKKAGSLHGYGLRNVRECVRRSRGSVRTVRENGVYTLSVLMNCGENLPLTSS